MADILIKAWSSCCWHSKGTHPESVLEVLVRCRKVLERLAELVQPQKAVAAKDTDQGHAHMCACVYAYRHAQMSDILMPPSSSRLKLFPLSSHAVYFRVDNQRRATTRAA